MTRLLHIIIYIVLGAITTMGQPSQRDKLSPWLRQLADRTPQRVGATAQRPAPASSRQTVAFVRLTDDSADALTQHGCRSLAHYGSLHIAEIPTDRLLPLAQDRRVVRVEASPGNHLLNDSMAVHLNATAAYTGQGLPQAFTGRGVVMGIMDVGFDLTHPTFYSRDTTDYRIRRFWDQLSADTVGSPLPVGRDFATRQALLALGHSRDGLDITHGTHTLGIAAGSGYDSHYRGMAPEADICLVANAVVDDLPYIDSTDVDKYTYATDALGFKYIFDYADAVGKPCVISFSEGSMQDFHGYDRLYYEFLDSLTGPGRIIVASAGNDGHNKNWVHKPRGQQRAGTFVTTSGHTLSLVVRADNTFNLRVVAYGEQPDTLVVSSATVLAQPDSAIICQVADYQLQAEAYPSSYRPEDTCYDLTFTSPSSIGLRPHLSVELLGTEADVELWRASGHMGTYSENPLLADAEASHYVHSPSSAPSVISVGASTYRDFIVNEQGDTMSYWPGTGGRLVDFSSRGPTFDGRIKPDCVAPGNNIISSYSSYYMETHPTANDLNWNVGTFTFGGRTYAWNSNSGTSMSAPAVGGAIALWLQACPTLSPQDVVALLGRTCRHYDASADYPNNAYGHGEVDVYAGLLDLLGLSDFVDIPRLHTEAAVSLSGNCLHIALPRPADAPVPLRLYDLKGRPVAGTRLPAGRTDYDFTLPRLPAGVYAVCAGSGSTLIRINH